MSVHEIPSRWLISVAFLAVLVFTGFGCKPDKFLTHLHQLRDDTKQRGNPADIRAAVLPMFSNELSSTNPLPKEITSLPIFSDDPTNIETGCPLANTNILKFHIGSGFGHWGIVVCRDEKDEQQLTNDSWYRPRLTPWKGGVYFFSDFR